MLLLGENTADIFLNQCVLKFLLSSNASFELKTFYVNNIFHSNVIHLAVKGQFHYSIMIVEYVGDNY